MSEADFQWETQEPASRYTGSGDGPEMPGFELDEEFGDTIPAEGMGGLESRLCKNQTVLLKLA